MPTYNSYSKSWKDCKLICEVYVTLLYKNEIKWSHVALWEYFLQERIQILWHKEQSNKEYSHWCRFNEVNYSKIRVWVFWWYLLKLHFVQCKIKTHKVQKMIYHIIKLGLSRKKGSEQSNSVTSHIAWEWGCAYMYKCTIYDTTRFKAVMAMNLSELCS
jgi:hypothetical protein